MLRADAPIAIQPRVKVYSPNRRFYALSVLAGHRTSVFSTASKKTPLWEIEGYRTILFLADDGEHLVEGYSGGNLLDAHVRPGDSFLSFYVKTKRVSSVSVAELFPHLEQMPHTASSIAWGNFLGFTASKQFSLLLYDGREIVFDTDTGKQISTAR